MQLAVLAGSIAGLGWSIWEGVKYRIWEDPADLEVRRQRIQIFLQQAPQEIQELRNRLEQRRDLGENGLRGRVNHLNQRR